MGGGGGAEKFTAQIFAQDSNVVKTQNYLARMEASKTYAMHHHRETIKSN